MPLWIYWAITRHNKCTIALYLHAGRIKVLFDYLGSSWINTWKSSKMNLWQDPLRNPVDKFMELYMKKRLDKLLEYFSEKKS